MSIYSVGGILPAEALSAMAVVLRQRKLRLLLVAAPGITAAVAILTATESNLALTAVLNIAVAVIVSSVLFIVVSLSYRGVAEEKMELMRATQQGLWHARFGQLLPIRHTRTGLYSYWYFRLRIQEEIERSQRFGHPFVLVVAKPEKLPAGEPDAWLGEGVHSFLRKTDLPALLRGGSLGVLLPHTEAKATGTFQKRLTTRLQPQALRIGVAEYPRDGADIDALLDAAEAAIANSASAAA
jgi:GGDEF domain-containing protein